MAGATERIFEGGAQPPPASAWASGPWPAPAGAGQYRCIVRDLPTGTVTFLFSDIEGSTRLLQAARA